MTGRRVPLLNEAWSNPHDAVNGGATIGPGESVVGGVATKPGETFTSVNECPLWLEPIIRLV